MKKILSILTVVAMLAVMIPVSTVGAFAETNATKPTDTWTSKLSYVDLSWCTTLDTANADKTVTVNGTHYYVKGDWTKKNYEITTAAQLAGLAYLSNQTSGDLFKGDVFTIKADIDLGAHLWEPISKTSKFRGAIIGDVNGNPAVISNMIIDTSTQTGVSVGLVGRFGGDSISNLTLKNAEITANSFTVGSFVGWQDGNIGAGRLNGKGFYENLVSDATITVTSSRSDRFDDVGGIVGYINNTNDSNNGIRFTDCVFTGTISAPYGDMVGGIIGGSQYDGGKGLEISDCVVVSEKLEWGKNNYYITKGTEDHNTGLGGIAGSIYTNGSADNLSYTVKNCYVAAKLITLQTEGTLTAKNVGGMCGVSCAQGKTFENCQFDGTVVGTADGVAGILSRYLNKGTFKNCVVSGIAIAQDGKASTLAGRSADSNLTVDGAYSSVKMLNAVGGTGITQITAATDLSALLAVKNGDVNVWTRAVGQLYPVLTIALPYLTGNTPSVAKSGADLGFCTFANGMKICNEAQLKGLELLKNGTTFAASYDDTLRFAPKLATKDLSTYSSNVSTLVKSKLGIADTIDTAESVINMTDGFCQVAVNASNSGGYDVRFAVLINGKDYSSVTMDIAGSRTVNGELVFGNFVTTDSITVCYEQLTEELDNGSQTHTAPEGWYYVVFVAENTDLSADTTFTLRATATADGGTVTNGVTVNYTVTAKN